MIREATDTDIDALVDLGCQFMVESGYARHLAINPHAQATLAKMLIDSPNGLVLVDERGGRIVGMIGIIATFHPHSGDPVMSELFWYVDPGHRGVGIKLLRKAEIWGQDNGIAKSITVAPNDKVCALYERLGYEKLETQYIKTL